MKGPLFTEVIRVQDGEFCWPEPHAARMAATMEHFFGSGAGACLPAEVPEGMREGLVKCRVVYDESVRRVEFAPYRLRRIASVALVRADGLDYRYKYADRSTLEELRRGSGCDEVVLLQEGSLTDRAGRCVGSLYPRPAAARRDAPGGTAPDRTRDCPAHPGGGAGALCVSLVRECHGGA